MSDKLEQLEFKLEKILGFRNTKEKLEKSLTNIWQNFSCLLEPRGLQNMQEMEIPLWFLPFTWKIALPIWQQFFALS